MAGCYLRGGYYLFGQMMGKERKVKRYKEEEEEEEE
jgi:hypothetical protein